MRFNFFMHSILQRQFKRVFGENVTIPPALSFFLELVSHTYEGFDEDRVLLDRSLEISSKEYLENNRRLEETRQKVEEQAKNLALQVAARTKELDARVSDLEDVRRAMTNLLEDLELEKKRSDKLAKDLIKFKLALDNASDMVIITDPEGTVIYGNRTVEKITGYKAEEAVGKKSGALWKLPMPLEFYRNMWDVIKNRKEVFTSEIQNKRKSGELYTANISISPVLSKEGEIEFFVGIERDITKEKEIDKAKTEFISLASHQLRTPLSTVNWYTESLLSGESGNVTGPQRQFLEQIYSSSQRMVTLVNSLLNVSRIEMGTFIVEPKETDLLKLLGSEITGLSVESNAKNIKLLFNSNVPSLKIQVDSKLMQMVLQNVIANAIKYSLNNSTIVINVIQTAQSVTISVADSGIGIPAKDQNQVFSKLFRADNAKEKVLEGTGLGLYLVKMIMDESGGKVWFKSEEGKGTIFYISLPLSGMIQKEGTRELS